MLTSDMLQYKYNSHIQLKNVSQAIFEKYCKQEHYLIIPPYYNANMQAIVLDGVIVGFVTYEIVRNEKTGFVLCYLKAIEISPLYRKQYIATYVIWYLLSNLTLNGKPIRGIYGDAYIRAVPFWRKIGGNFNMSKKQMKEYFRLGFSVEFKLSLSRLIKALDG